MEIHVLKRAVEPGGKKMLMNGLHILCGVQLVTQDSSSNGCPLRETNLSFVDGTNGYRWRCPEIE